MKHQLKFTSTYRCVPAISAEIFDQLWLLNHGHASQQCIADLGHSTAAWRAANHEQPMVQALGGWLALMESLHLCAQEREWFVLRYLAASLLISISDRSDILADFVLRSGGKQHGSLIAVHRNFLCFAAEADLIQVNAGRTFFASVGDIHSCCQGGRNQDVFWHRDESL